MRSNRPLVCPDCGRRLTNPSLACSVCGDGGTVRNGIPSFVAPSAHADSDWLDERDLERLATSVETGSVRSATNELLDDHDHRFEVLNDIYNVNRDDWRILAANRITGRCLDLSAGYGRRSLLLAELVDEVYAVDSNLAKLRVLTARDDYDSGRNVFPVHTTVNRLPFSSEMFDTVVADLTGPNNRCLRERIAHLRRYLREDGSLVLLLDGWARQLDLPYRIGLERRSSTERGDVLRATPKGYRSAMETMGFDQVTVLALFPTVRNVQYVFSIEDDDAKRALAVSVFPGDGFRARVGRLAAEIGIRSNLLQYGCPSYCVIGRRAGTSSFEGEPVEFTSPLLVSGRTRSVVLEFDVTSGDLAAIHKIPNRARHVPITERETRVLSELRSTEEPITRTLPDGRTVPSRFGASRQETPVSGHRLKPRSNDLDSFRRTLRIGYDWLIEFQRTFGSETITRSPDEIESDLSFSPFELSPPPIDTSLDLFYTPVHGDYVTNNVYVSNGQVQGVIDWEYGALSGWPITDAGSFLLNVAKNTFGSWRDGFEEVFYGDTEYGRVARTVARAYCASVGIRYRALLLYLPMINLHRIGLEWTNGTTTTYTTELDELRRETELLYDVMSDLEPLPSESA